MKNNQQWFQSPLTKTVLKEYHYEPQESNWNRHLDIYSPQPCSIFKINHQHNQLSPWREFINSDNRQQNLSLPCSINQDQPNNQVIEEKLIYSEDQNDLQTPVRRTQTYRSDIQDGDLHTTGKKSEVEINLSGKKSRPREKGLRKLSQRAFQIVKEFKNATYKQVAAKLVVQLGDSDFQQDKSSKIQNKQEQNIKRRVYDALNVLIALGVLRKQGRKIVSDIISMNPKGYGNVESQKLLNIKSLIDTKNIQVQQKRKALQKMTEQFQILKKLQQRNRTKTANKDIIMLPFIVVMIPRGLKQTINLTHQPHHIVTITLQNKPNPLGDMDTLKWLNLQEQTLQQAQNNPFS